VTLPIYTDFSQCRLCAFNPHWSDCGVTLTEILGRRRERVQKAFLGARGGEGNFYLKWRVLVNKISEYVTAVHCFSVVFYTLSVSCVCLSIFYHLIKVLITVWCMITDIIRGGNLHQRSRSKFWGLFPPSLRDLRLYAVCLIWRSCSSIVGTVTARLMCDNDAVWRDKRR